MPPLLCYQGLTRLLASSQIAVTFGTARKLLEGRGL